MPNKTSQHILNTSTNLLGFCLFIITSLHIANYSVESIIDEYTSLAALLLIFSCLLSFFSLQTAYETRAKRAETIAEYLFAAALIGILIIIILIDFNYIK